MSHPETIYPAPASYERAQAALAALDTARESLRSSEYSEADQRTGWSSHQRRARAPAASAREASPRTLAARPIARPHAHPSIRDASATRSSQRSAGWRMSWGRRGRSGGRSRRSGRCWRSSIGRTSSGETRFTSLRANRCSSPPSGSPLLSAAYKYHTVRHTHHRRGNIHAQTASGSPLLLSAAARLRPAAAPSPPRLHRRAPLPPRMPLRLPAAPPPLVCCTRLRVARRACGGSRWRRGGAPRDAETPQRHRPALRRRTRTRTRTRMPPWSQDAWEAHGAKPRSFKSWKSKIHGVLLTDAVDQLEACCLLDTS